MSNLKDVKPKKAVITLGDGVERELNFTLNAMAEMEDRYGSVEDAFKALEGNSIKAIRFFLWVGLMDYDLTEQQVGSMIDVNNINDIMESVQQAMDADMPDPNVPALEAPSTEETPTQK